jgi:uncharacterized protein
MTEQRRKRKTKIKRAPSPQCLESGRKQGQDWVADYPIRMKQPALLVSTLVARLSSRPWAQWPVLAVLSGAFLAALEALHLPAALLLGPMLAGILMAAAGGTIRVPGFFYGASQALVGSMIANSLPLSHLASVTADWPVYLAGVSVTIAAAAVIGWTLARWRVLPGTTAIWGSSPGAAGTMTVMSEAFGADVRLVAFMQYLRVMCVAAAASAIASLCIAGTAHPAAAAANWFASFDLRGFAATMAVVATAATIGKLSRLPAGVFLLPMIATGVCAATGWLTIVLPPWLLAVSYAVFGWSIGLKFTRAILVHAARALPGILAAIAVLIAICGACGLVLAKVAGLDPLTAYLATSPGGADSIAIIAASSRVDMAFVMTMQMVRFLIVTVSGPALARFLAARAS